LPHSIEGLLFQVIIPLLSSHHGTISPDLRLLNRLFYIFLSLLIVALTLVLALTQCQFARLFLSRNLQPNQELT
jgi:hypothetical protein